MKGNFHVRFLEGGDPAMGSCYSTNGSDRARSGRHDGSIA